MRNIIGSRFVEDIGCHSMADEAAELYERDVHMGRENVIGNRGVSWDQIGNLIAVDCPQAEDLKVLCYKHFRQHLSHSRRTQRQRHDFDLTIL